MTSSGSTPGAQRSSMRPLRRRLLLIALLGVLVLVTAAIVAARRDETATQDDGARMHDALCEAIRGGDPDEAAARFTDRIHTPLHELAAAAESKDRVVTARLLEAKQRVEADLDGERAGVLRVLEQLEPRVRDALAVIGISTEPCGGSSS